MMKNKLTPAEWDAVVMSCLMAGFVVASANVNTLAIARVLRMLFG